MRHNASILRAIETNAQQTRSQPAADAQPTCSRRAANSQREEQREVLNLAPTAPAFNASSFSMDLRRRHRRHSHHLLPAMSDPEAEVLLISSDDEDAWDTAIKQTMTFKIAFGEFMSKKAYSPTLTVMRELLQSFVFQPPDDYFTDPESDQAIAFKSVKSESRVGWKPNAKTSRDKKWTMAFVSQYLAILLVLRDMEEKARKDNNDTETSEGKSSDLEKAFDELRKVYKPCLREYKARALAEANKKHTTPSLDYQLSGPRLQDSFKWATFGRDKENCPICEHFYTMRVQTVENLAEVNAQVARAVANNPAKKAIMKSPRHGCYCYQFDCKGGDIDGDGCFLCEQLAAAKVPAKEGASEWCLWDCPICNCSCKCTFENDKRYTIQDSLRAMARQQDAEAKKTGKGNSVGSSSSSADNRNSGDLFLDRLAVHRDTSRKHEEMSNRRKEVFKNSDDAEAEMESVGSDNGEDEDDREQNIESRAAMELFHDPLIRCNPNVSRELQKFIPLTRDVVDTNENDTNAPEKRQKTVSIAAKRKEIHTWKQSALVAKVRGQSAIDRTPS